MTSKRNRSYRLGHEETALDYEGVDPFGRYDSTNGINNYLSALGKDVAHDPGTPAYTWITANKGAVAQLPDGVYRVDGPLVLPDRVTIRGESMTSTMIVAGPGYTDTSVITAGGASATFDSRIEHVRIHANNQVAITKVVNVDSWQEHCGLFHCSIDGFQSGAVGLYVDDTSAGAAGWPVERCTFGGFSGCKAAIEVAATVPNAFQFQVRSTTLNFSGLATSGLLLQNGRLHAEDLHVERCTHGINLVQGAALLMNITGTGTLENLVTLDAGYLSRARAFMLDPNGATGYTWFDQTASPGTNYTGFKAFVAHGAD